MATSAQIHALVEAHYTHDEPRFRNCVAQIAASKSSSKLSRILRRYLEQPATTQLVPLNLPRQQGGLWTQVEPIDPTKLILPKAVANRFDWIVEQHRHATELRCNGLQPPSLLLFHGSPGVGKSMGARVLANLLQLPALLLRVDAVVTRCLGDSAKKIREALETCRLVPAVYIMDELDSIGKQRSNEDSSAAKEGALTLNTLLTLLDITQPAGPIVATCNRVDLLDPALLRRWRLLEFWSTPDEQAKLASTYGIARWSDLRCEVSSMAEVTAVCEEAQRIALLSELDIHEAALSAADELEFPTFRTEE